jgi:transcription elongation factor Elf1
MTGAAGNLNGVHVSSRGGTELHPDHATVESSDGHSPIARAFAKRGLDLASLSSKELHELDEGMWERLSPVFDEIVEHWQEEHGQASESEKIDRELRRRIIADRDRHDSAFECEGCGHQHWDSCVFITFHGLLLCDGCAENARDELRDIQRPLIEALAADPTLERALALGFELTRSDDGRLAWVGDDDDYDGGSHPYADEKEALEDLVEELTVSS